MNLDVTVVADIRDSRLSDVACPNWIDLILATGRVADVSAVTGLVNGAVEFHSRNCKCCYVFRL